LDELQARYETSWQPGYAHFPRVLLDWNLKTGVELGVAFGGHSEAILRTGVSKLYGVDSYRHRSNYDDPMNLSQPDFDRLYDRTCRRLSYYGDRFIPIRRDSDKAVSDVPGLVDFVYIDADHSYEGVFSDLCRWITKVRIGGIIGGHDYGHKDFPGVRQAIDEFFRRFGWQVHVEGDGVWWVHTKSLNISYFIPAYNREDTITAAIESIVMGNLEPGDEVVIVDDGSSDNTARLINELASRWPAITVITHSRNKGGAAARNTAVEQAKQPIVFCLDSDNILAPRSVGPLLEFLVCSGADVAAFSEIRYFSGPAADITHSWFLKSGRFGLREYLGGIRVPGASGNYLFTKESWLRAGGYPEFAGALDTWGFGLRQVATGSKMMVKQHSHYLHRCGADSYWVRQTRQGNVDLLALQVLLPFLHLIDHRDADYVMSRKGRNSWLLNLDRRPLRLRAAATSRVPRYSSRFPTNIRSLLRQFVWHPFLNVTRPVRDAIGLRKRRFGVS
jgi:glycosyltransferase involved in cell wall biosynthesis